MSTLPHKGFGRIYVDKPENIKKVEQIIKELDEYEFEYMPVGIVAHFSEYPSVKYTHKFDDMDMDKLTATCWNNGIHIWVFDSGRNEYPENMVA